MSTNILGTVIIGFVLVILNVVFLAIIFFMRRRMAVVSQWPSTMGTVMMPRSNGVHPVRVGPRRTRLCNIPIRSTGGRIRAINSRRVLK